MLIRSPAEAGRAHAAVEAAGAKGAEFDEAVEAVPGAVSMARCI